MPSRALDPRFLEQALGAVRDAVVVTDAGATVTFMNAEAERILGVRREDALGRDAHDVVRLEADVARKALAAVRSATKDGATTPFESALVEGSVRPLAGEDGARAGALMVFRDVEERRRLEERLATAERLSAIGTMVAGMQHEINNPLATVIANLEYLRDVVRRLPADDDALREAALALEDASEGAERVRRSIDDMRHFSHADGADLVRVDVVTAMESAARITAHAVRHHATLRRAFEPAPPVLARQAQLTHAFVNLLLSAARATGDGRADRHAILVASRRDGAGNAVVEITHDGSDPTGGDGLELTLSRGIVSSLGGTIEIVRSGGPGATLRVTLPPAPEQPDATPAPPQAEKRGARVFVIDDEAAIGKALRRMLGREHEVVIETDAEAALATLGRERFDVVFCDLMMPKLSGMDLFAALSRTNPALAARVVFLTGGAFSPRSVEFLRAHASRSLAKPFTREAVTAVIRRMLE
jgi:PAS domain S-box-containing protein